MASSGRGNSCYCHLSVSDRLRKEWNCDGSETYTLRVRIARIPGMSRRMAGVAKGNSSNDVLPKLINSLGGESVSLLNIGVAKKVHQGVGTLRKADQGDFGIGTLLLVVEHHVGHLAGTFRLGVVVGTEGGGVVDADRVGSGNLKRDVACDHSGAAHARFLAASACDDDVQTCRAVRRGGHCQGAGRGGEGR